MRIDTSLKELGNRVLQTNDAFKKQEDFKTWLNSIVYDMQLLYKDSEDSIFQYELGDVVNLLTLLSEKI